MLKLLDISTLANCQFSEYFCLTLLFDLKGIIQTYSSQFINMTIIYKNPTVIAEIGCNHKGNIDIAKDMIQIASNCGASYVKLKREITNIKRKIL